MTSFWLLLSDFFKWTFEILGAGAYVINWILFLVACGYFLYWCWILVAELGNNKDKEYYSPTEGKYPYYDPKIYNKEVN